MCISRILFPMATVFFLLAALTSNAATIIVPSEQPTIQAGIDAASDGDTVLVKTGTYTGIGNRNISYSGKNIVVKSEDGPESTIIDVEMAICTGAVGFSDGEDSTAVLEGFSIINCISDAVWSINSSPTIRGNVFYDNDLCCVFDHIEGHIGAAIYCREFGHPVIKNNTIYVSGGFGISLCTEATVSDNWIEGDTGIGIFFNASWDSCIIERNVIKGFKDNSCVCSETTEFDRGTGIKAWIDPQSKFSITENTIIDAQVGIDLYNKGAATIARNILSGIQCASLVLDTSVYALDATVEYNDFFDLNDSCIYLIPPGSEDMAAHFMGLDGNFSADPMFCNPLNGDYHIAFNSPCAPDNNLCACPIGALGVGCGSNRTTISPNVMSAIDAYTYGTVFANVNIFNIEEGYSIYDIDTSTVMINDSISPINFEYQTADPAGEVLNMSFSKSEFVLGYMPLWDTTIQVYTIKGLFNGNTEFSTFGWIKFIGHRSGDANGDGLLNIFDITYLITYLYLNGPRPLILDAVDVNSDNIVDIFDLTYLVSYLYLQGPEPVHR